jgi:hypothetical protein
VINSPSTGGSTTTTTSPTTTGPTTVPPIPDAGFPPPIPDAGFPPPIPDAGLPPPIGADCGPPSGTVQPYDSEASGTVAGSAVHADICNAPAHLYVSPYTTPAGRVLLFLNNAASASITVETPAGATDPSLMGMIAVSSPTPGVYRSSDGTACGSLGLTFSPPVATDCNAGFPPNCPPGCGYLCSGFGCGQCVPFQYTVDYQAQGASDCQGTTTLAAGSWTLTLTSPEMITGNGGPGQTYYAPHGSLTATLVNAANGTDTATLTMDF